MTHRTPHSRRQGFTLIELSIVLVIIGLIVGGILVGQDLIHAAELRNVVTEVERFKTAVNTFRLKYNCIPGDCPSVTSVFGSTDTNGNPVTNGNGDGQIRWFDEGYEAWQELALAGLVPGAFTGNGAGGGVSGTNIAGSKFKTGAYQFMYSLFNTGMNPATALPGDTQVNRLLFGQPVSGSFAYGGIMLPQDAYSIDTKYDDGKPASGIIGATGGGGSTLCAQYGSSTTDPLTIYLPTHSQPTCYLTFVIGN